MAPAFARSADFAIDKPAGSPCPNLRPDFRCGIHSRLRDNGFPGCTVYDCFGAGQKVAQVTFGGRDWRGAPDIAGTMFSVFPVMRRLHELLWYLTQALGYEGVPRSELREAFSRTEALTRLGPQDLLALDLGEHWQSVNAVLSRAGQAARAGANGPDRRGADLVGADLRAVDLHGANLRGALLIGADLRGADLRLADLTGVDMRGADLTAADLSSSLFLHQSQVDSARGDARTRLPAGLRHPPHWTTG